MPNDTVWIENAGIYLIFDSNKKIDTSLDIKIKDTDGRITNITYTYSLKNTERADSILKSLSKHKYQSDFDAQKAYYDNLGTKLEFLVSLGLIAIIFYAIYRARKKARNPFDENDRDWVEIGSSPRNNYGRGFGGYYPDYRKAPPKQIPNWLTYHGSELKFSDEQIIFVLDKRFPYFTKLGVGERTRFLYRLKKFMKSKIFKIHDKNGFKEMPILLSATAIQISFGLEEYMLPFYQYIHIFPQEFIGLEPNIRFLEGNVSNNAIHVSWKHFLKGYELQDDGQNVGLHEMAHAYYAQSFTFKGNKDDGFVNRFPSYTSFGNKVFESEKIKSNGLYSEYALKNFQEFWAESVELFFEKPSEMKAQYGELYESMSLLLNQKSV